MDLGELFKRQLIMVSGKGGTGKTTLSILFALMAAKQGKKVLLCHVNRLGDQYWETSQLQFFPKLQQMNITPSRAFKEYVLLKLKSERLYRNFFESPTIIDILRRAAPALNELLIIGKVYWECKQKNFLFIPKWDHVIVDMPATGHAKTILNIPQVVLNIFQKGLVAYETGKIQNLIEDQERSCLVLAGLPEYMVVQETLEFANTVRTKMKVALGPIFLNRFPLQPLSVESEPLFENVKEGLPSSLYSLTQLYQERYLQAKTYQQRLEQEYQGLLYTLPMIYGENQNHEFLQLLEHQLLEQWNMFTPTPKFH